MEKTEIPDLKYPDLLDYCHAAKDEIRQQIKTPGEAIRQLVENVQRLLGWSDSRGQALLWELGLLEERGFTTGDFFRYVESVHSSGSIPISLRPLSTSE